MELSSRIPRSDIAIFCLIKFGANNNVNAKWWLYFIKPALLFNYDFSFVDHLFILSGLNYGNDHKGSHIIIGTKTSAIIVVLEYLKLASL